MGAYESKGNRAGTVVEITNDSKIEEQCILGLYDGDEVYLLSDICHERSIPIERRLANARFRTGRPDWERK